MAGRDARLKVLKISNVRNLNAFESLSLTKVQPRQGTLCQWPKVGLRVESLVSCKINNAVGSLTPDLQEVMCMEFLRSEKAKELGLPKILHTLAPVGRTLKDLDILAVGEDLEPISAQVTYYDISSGAAKRKLNKLNPYSENSSKTIFFCNCKSVSELNGHIFSHSHLFLKSSVRILIVERLGLTWLPVHNNCLQRDNFFHYRFDLVPKIAPESRC